MFHSQVIHRTDGTFWAVRKDHTVDTESAVDAVPGDSIQLEGTADLAERELALRLWFDGGYDGPVHHSGKNVFVVNFRSVAESRTDTKPYFDLVKAIKEKMTKNGADDGALQAPGNQGYGVAMSYLGGVETDSDAALFMKAVCTGETWAVSIWNGEQPSRMPGDRPGRAADDGQFLVVSPSEAETVAEGIANQKADEVLSGLDDAAANYFDRDRFVADQIAGHNGGVGGLIAVDGVGHTVDLEEEGMTFMIFRVA